VITVLKAGFLGSARYGNGIVVARLSDGTWSAPSAIGLGGAGFGGQIGFELTDFVFVLNDPSAVRAFSQQGSLTLGGNVSLAAGPVGRNAEAAGAASLKGVAGVFSYSKTKGLFAGVSLEGSAIIERRDANEKLYRQRFTAAELLGGAVRPPPEATSLMNVLNSRVFAGVTGGDDIYNDMPQYDDRHDEVVWEGRRGSGFGEGVRRERGNGLSDDDYQYSDKPKRASTWADDVYDRPAAAGVSRGNTVRNNRTSGFDDDYTYSDRKTGPGRPAAPKPQFGASKVAALDKNQAVALFSFDADQPGDLGFKKGDVITVIKKTDKAEDWWYVIFIILLFIGELGLGTDNNRTGMIGGRTGIFPSNYVEMKK
jgi:SH3 domain-containing YSC84-like protein 1